MELRDIGFSILEIFGLFFLYRVGQIGICFVYIVESYYWEGSGFGDNLMQGFLFFFEKR